MKSRVRLSLVALCVVLVAAVATGATFGLASARRASGASLSVASVSQHVLEGKSPLRLAMSDGGKDAWVLEVGQQGQVELNEIDTESGASRGVVPLNVAAGSGFFSAVTANDQLVAVGWQERVFIFDRAKRVVSSYDLPVPTQPVDASLIPVDTLQQTIPMTYGITAIELDDSGGLWVARHLANSLFTLDTTSGAIEEMPLPAEFGSADSMTVANSGNSLWLVSGMAKASGGLSVPGNKVAHSMIARLDISSGRVKVFKNAALRVLCSSDGQVRLVEGSGVSKAIVNDQASSLGTLTAGSMDTRVGNRGMAIAVGNDVVVASPNGLAHYDSKGQVVGVVTLPTRFEHSTGGDGPSHDASSTDGRDPYLTPVAPEIGDIAASSDGSIWVVVPNYHALDVWRQ